LSLVKFCSTSSCARDVIRFSSRVFIVMG
jgi:hypothetical protein